jgi:hypothetical protein
MDKKQLIRVIQDTPTANITLKTVASTAPPLSRMAVGKEIAKVAEANRSGELILVVIRR